MEVGEVGEKREGESCRKVGVLEVWREERKLGSV